MEPIALAILVFAVLLIATRGPLVFAPATTLAVYRRCIATPRRVRALGAVAAVFAALLILTGQAAHEEHGGLALGLEGLGWVLAGSAAWLAIHPPGYQRLVESILDAISDPAVLRIIGVISIAVGLALVGLALTVL